MAGIKYEKSVYWGLVKVRGEVEVNPIVNLLSFGGAERKARREIEKLGVGVIDDDDYKD